MLQDFLHLSSENMRLLEEQSRLEKRIEESERKGEESNSGWRMNSAVSGVGLRRRRLQLLFNTMATLALFYLRSLERLESKWRRVRAGD